MRNQQKARELIDDELLDDIEKIMKQTYVHMWQKQPDQDKRDSLWLAYNMVDDMRVALSTIAQTGEMNDRT